MSDTVALSARAREVPASPIRRLAPLAEAARREGKTIYGLNIGQPDVPTPPQILDRLKSWKGSNVPYGPSQGLPEFLETLLAYYARHDIRLNVEDVLVTTGGSEAILFVLAMVTDPGDEFLVFEPFYTNYNGFGAMLGIEPVPVTTRVQDGYHLPDRASIETSITPRTRAVVICSPNNPTGTVYGDAEMETLAAVCRDHGLYLVADEVYREFAYDGRSHRSALTLDGLGEQVVVVDSLSKRASLCGVRVGCIASRNRELMQAVLRCAQARLCPPTLGQFMACGLGDVPEEYFREVVAEYEKRRDLVYEALESMPGTTLLKPEGAFYTCPRLPIDDGQRFAEFMLRDFSLRGETVMLAPADGFYASPGLGRDEVRIAYVLETTKLRRAMEALAAGLESYPGRQETIPDNS